MINYRRMLSLWSMVMLLATTPVAARTLYVSPIGSDTNDGRSITTAYATLGKALGVAVSGDKIVFTGILQPTGLLPIDGKENITIEGYGNDLSDNIIEGTGQSALFSLTSGSSLVLRNLTVRGWGGTTQGGVISLYGSRLVVENAELYNNQTMLDENCRGGVVYASNSTLQLRGVTLYGNCSYQGGAVYAFNSAVPCSNVTFEQNRTWVDDAIDDQPSDAHGGALVLNNCSATLTSCVFARNSAKGDGGAIWLNVNQNGHFFDMDDCALVGNHAGGSSSRVEGMNGGAVFYGAFCPFEANVRSCTLSLNAASEAGGAFFYAGDAADSRLNIVNCTVVKNRLLGSGSGAGVCAKNKRQARVDIVNTIVENNLNADGKTDDTSFGSSTNLMLRNSAVGTGAASTNMVPQMDCVYMCFPLLEGGEWTGAGDAVLAKEYGCLTDQHGLAVNKNYMGAVQALDGERLVPDITGVEAVSADATGAAALYYNLAGQRLNDRPSGKAMVKKTKKAVILLRQ